MLHVNRYTIPSTLVVLFDDGDIHMAEYQQHDMTGCGIQDVVDDFAATAEVTFYTVLPYGYVGRPVSLSKCKCVGRLECDYCTNFDIRHTLRRWHERSEKRVTRVNFVRLFGRSVVSLSKCTAPTPCNDDDTVTECDYCHGVRTRRRASEKSGPRVEMAERIGRNWPEPLVEYIA